MLQDLLFEVFLLLLSAALLALANHLRQRDQSSVLESGGALAATAASLFVLLGLGAHWVGHAIRVIDPSAWVSWRDLLGSVDIVVRLEPKPEPTGSTTMSSERAEPSWYTSVRGPGDTPLTVLETNATFDLRVRFAWRSSERKCDGEIRRVVGPRFPSFVADGVRLDLVLVFDDEHFALPDDNAVRKIWTSNHIENKDCTYGAATAARFRLQTRDRTDYGSLAIVVYRNGRPIDQIPLRICVACRERELVVVDDTVDKYLARFLNDTDKEPESDVALYVLDLSDDLSTGILTLKTGPEEFSYDPWPLRHRAAANVRDSIAKTYAPVLGKTSDAAALAAKGEELARAIFPGEKGTALRARLEEFLTRTRPPGTPRPSFFVRITGVTDRSPIVFPVGLMAMKSITDGTGFIGRHARVVMPLEEQNYGVFGQCPQNILNLLPDSTVDDAALKRARAALGDVTSERWRNAAREDHRWSSGGSFGRWLLGNPRLDSGAMFLLAHHSNDSLWTDSNDTVEAHAVDGRIFQSPSWVVLNGCSTRTESSGSSFALKFNQSGAQAVIATHSAVDGALAGTYFRCLDDVLTKAADDPGYDLGRAHLDATFCVWDRGSDGEPAAPEQRRWGPNALKYTLLGNQSLRACPIAARR